MAATCNTPAKHSPSKSQCWLECEGLTQSGRTHERNVYTHVHTHTYTHCAPGQNSTDVLAVAACESARAGVFDGDGAGDGEGLVRGSGGVWGARREAGAPSRWASSEILMPRSASDLPSDSRADMSRGWKVTQIRRRRLGKKPSKTTKTRSQNLFSDELLGSFFHQNRAEVVTPIDNSDAAGLVVPTVTRLASRVASPWHHERERWHF